MAKKTQNVKKEEKETPKRNNESEVRKRKNSNKTPKKATKKTQNKNRKPKVEKVQLTEFQKTCQELKKTSITNIRRYPVVFLITSASVCLLIALYFVGESLDMTGKNQKLPSITESVSMEISHGGRKLGSVKIGLFGTRCPLTVTNFVMLANHDKGYGYKGSTFHQVVQDVAIMGGDIVNGDGSSGKAALEQTFEFEYIKIRNAFEGLVGMLPLRDNVDSQKSSQFYITLGPFPAVDGYATVFGKVTEGMEVIRELGQAGVGENFVPTSNITIDSLTYEV